MWFVPEFILIILLTILVDYLAAILIERFEGRKRKRYLFISVVSTCAILFWFKYFNFFIENLNAAAVMLGFPTVLTTLQIILPIGLSFHTFQSLAYVIEVYRGNQKAERHFGIYSLYVLFYPQLVAGPIERPQNLLFQFREWHLLDASNVSRGLVLIFWGLFKKMVVADRLALFVNQVYGAPTEFFNLAVLLATLFFAFQIYFDFSGYTDIARGAALVMGFKLMKNFDNPYLSRSVSEFWKRWHISLSTWFKDYLYIPLGGNRGRLFRRNLNLVLVFVVSGLWHGASWTFVIWGALNGLYLVVGSFRKAKSSKNIFQIPVTFALICFSWIFFRASDLKSAGTLIRNLFTGWDTLAQSIMSAGTRFYFPKEGLGAANLFGNLWLTTSLALIGIVVSVERLQKNGELWAFTETRPAGSAGDFITR